MPWIELDGASIHYSPAPGANPSADEVRAEVQRVLMASAAQEAARLREMPTEQDALRVLFQAYQRLKELGWREAIYCPKDGSSFDVIEAGSTGIHRCHYQGEWPKGSWWVEGAGDLWPSRPILYRQTEEDKARAADLRAKLAAAAEEGTPRD